MKKKPALGPKDVAASDRKLCVAPVINDTLHLLGIPHEAFQFEIAALHEGELWSSARRPALQYNIKMIAWRHDTDVVADVSLEGGHKIEGRHGTSVLLLNFVLAGTLNNGLPGLQLARAIKHPLTARPEYVIESVYVPSHGLTRRIAFSTPGEPLAERPPGGMAALRKNPEFDV